MNKAQKLLKELEWSKTYSYCTGWPCCPVCNGIKPGNGADAHGNLPINSDHKPNCKLIEALKQD